MAVTKKTARINPERLVLARKNAGYLTIAGAARAITVAGGMEFSDSRLLNYEHGHRIPPADTLMLIAKVYGIKDALWFTRPLSTSEKAFITRRKHTLSV
jgi:transcriptional regulator with XRE-family HTH domain